MTGVQKLTKQRDLVAAAFNVIESKSRVLAVMQKMMKKNKQTHLENY